MEPQPTFRGTVIKIDGSALKNFNKAILAMLVKRLAELKRPEEVSILVVSAFRDVAKRMENIYKFALHKEDEMREAIAGLEAIFTLHQDTLNGLVPETATYSSAKDMETLHAEAFKLLRQLSRKSMMANPPTDVTERVKAGMLAIAGKLASLVMKAVLLNNGYHGYLMPVESFAVGLTNENGRRYTDAIVDPKATAKKLRTQLEEYAQHLVHGVNVSEMRGTITPLIIIPDSIGVNEHGDVVNFGQDTLSVHVVRAMEHQEIIFFKDADEDKLLETMDWYDLRTSQATTGFELVGDTAIGTAILYEIRGVIVDFETGKRYTISC